MVATIKEVKVAILGHAFCRNYEETKKQLFQFFKKLALQYDEVEIIFDRYVQIEKKGQIVQMILELLPRVKNFNYAILKTYVTPYEIPRNTPQWRTVKYMFDKVIIDGNESFSFAHKKFMIDICDIAVFYLENETSYLDVLESARKCGKSVVRFGLPSGNAD